MKVPSYQTLRLDHDSGTARVMVESRGIVYLYTISAGVAWARSYIDWQREEFVRKFIDSRLNKVQRVAEY